MSDPVLPSDPHTHCPHVNRPYPRTRAIEAICCLCGTLGTAALPPPVDDGHGPYAPREAVKAVAVWVGNPPRWGLFAGSDGAIGLPTVEDAPPADESA